MTTPVYIPIWIELIVLMKQGNTEIKASKLLDATYSHIHKLAKMFEENKWVVKKKVGRINKFTFTEEGNKIANACGMFITECYPYIPKRK